MKRAWLACGFLLLLAAVACGAPGRKTPTAGSPTPTGTPTPGATLPAALPTATATPLGSGAVPTPSPIPATKVPLCARYELQIELQVSTSFEDFWSQIDGKGHVPLTADLSQDPPRLTGSGEVPVSGEGMADECPVVYSGAFVYTISGEILTDESGNPVLHLVGQVEGQVFGSSPCGGGGGGMPVPERWEITFPYQDRATESYTFSAPGATGRSTWTLDILCEP